jgi:predicted nucleotide-binding protein
MSLDRNQIDSFISSIAKSDKRSFSSVTLHLFSYLQNNASNNNIYKAYELSQNKYKKWISYNPLPFLYIPDNWKLPEDFEECKELSYFLYKKIAADKDDGGKTPETLFGKITKNENVEAFNNTFWEYFKTAIDDIVKSDNTLSPVNKQPQKATIFIVHGHDDELKTEVQLLLTRADLIDIVLHEQPDGGRTIIDKLIAEGSAASYVIALLSPDDMTEKGNYRARQNVILEIGYFLGKLGKNRVRLMAKGDIEIPSDLSGILYTPYDKSGAWKMKLLKEIQSVGITVNIEKAIKKL